jgi:methionyl-tRNA formyltransferase
MDPTLPIHLSKSSEADVPAVLLIGYGSTAPAAFRSLGRQCRLVGLVREGGAGHPDDLMRAASELNVPVFSGESMAALEAAIAEVQPNVVVISSYSRIITSALLERATFVNVHYSPLPQYRGRANVNWAIINGEAKAAISIHLVDPGLDSGNLLFQEEIQIGRSDTVTDLYLRLDAILERELGKAVVRVAAGELGQPQRGEVSYCCSRAPDDGEVNWRASTVSIYRLIRALAPPFAAFTFLDGLRLEIYSAVPRPDAPSYVGRVPGRVVGRSPKQGWVDVLTGDGILRLVDMRADGRAVAPAAELITSTRQTLGLSRKQLLDRLNTLEHRLARVECLLAGEQAYRGRMCQMPAKNAE